MMDRVKSAVRATLVVAGAVLLTFAVLFGGHWVDDGDGTCGGAYRPDIWLDRNGCEGTMALRATVAVAALGAGVSALLVAATRRSNQ